MGREEGGRGGEVNERGGGRKKGDTNPSKHLPRRVARKREEVLPVLSSLLLLLLLLLLRGRDV